MGTQTGVKWVRFRQEGQDCWGRVEGDAVHVCVGSPLRADHHCDAHCGRERLPLDAVELLPPCLPTKIVCIGRNYGEHARELGHEVPKTPLFFLKPPSALLPSGGTILLPPLSRQVEYEGELGVVIKQRCARLTADADLLPYILGFTCINDVTARDLQNSDPQWTRAKGFDTFCPVGPYVVEPGAGVAGGRLGAGFALETRVNGELRQHGNSDDFIFSLAQIFAAITAVMTLEPGDLVATGTPAGVGPLRPGDRVSVAIAGIGTLDNLVAPQPSA